MDELITIIDKVVNVGIGVFAVYASVALIIFGIALFIILYIFKSIREDRKQMRDRWRR